MNGPLHSPASDGEPGDPAQGAANSDSGPLRALGPATESLAVVHDGHDGHDSPPTWRGPLRHRTVRGPLNTLSTRALADLLEEVSCGWQGELTAGRILALIKDGKGTLVATRHGVAFCVDRGPIEGVELRYLYVMPGNRSRGAARALVAKLRAHYHGRRISCTFSDEQWSRFARSLGFAAKRRADGRWLVATDLTVLPNTGFDTADEARPAPRFNTRKALLASALVALSTASCIDI